MSLIWDEGGPEYISIQCIDDMWHVTMNDVLFLCPDREAVDKLYNDWMNEQ